MLPSRPAVASSENVPEFARRIGLSAEDYATLEQTALFAGLGEEELAHLLVDASLRSYGRGHVVFVQGDPADRLFVVLDGWVRLSRVTAEGQQVTIHIFGPGESIAEAAVFQMRRYPVTGEAVDHTRLLVISARSLLARLRARTDLCFNMMASMALRLHRFVEQLEQITSRSAAERVALFLSRLCPGERGPCELRLPLDKTLIAARLGMQPETLSRAFAKLRTVGVETHGHRLMVRDVAALRAFARLEED